MASMTVKTGARVPLIRRATHRELSPVVHWAQQHRREREKFHLSRRIYDFELLYVISGLVRCRIEPQQEPFLLKAGELVLLPAGPHHDVTIAEGESADFLGVHFDFFGEQQITRDEDIIVNEEAVNEAGFCPMPDIPEWGGTLPFRYEEFHPHIVPLLETVIVEFTQKMLGYELRCKGAMLEIVSLLYRGRQEGAAAGFERTPPAYADALRDIAADIRRDCAQDWTNERLARRLNVNADYMARLFKQATGMNPKLYVQRTRHQQAKKLLGETDEKVRAVGQAVGYDDPAYFCRVFKRLEGISPERYRQLSRIF